MDEQPSLFPDEREQLRKELLTQIDRFGYRTVEAELRRLAPTVIAASAPARWGDPETSHRAGPRYADVGRFSAKSRQARLLAVFGTGVGLTDQEAAARVVGLHAAPSALEGCRRRCSDLRAVNYIFDTGIRRANPGSNDDSIVWAISDAGHKALVLLDHVGWSR